MRDQATSRTGFEDDQEEIGRRTRIMTKRIFSKVVWFGRATTFMVGLAVILALTVGVVSTALAGTGVGARFDLGKTNTVSAISKLVGSVDGPSLLIDNNSTNSAATALNLQVEAGKAPMKVNSGTKVANLNADKLDGMDAGQLQGFSTLRVVEAEASTIANQNGSVTASCRAEEQAISGGVQLRIGDATKISYFEPGGVPVVDSTGKITGWKTSWFPEVDSTVKIFAVCAS
jgi:hypothetical protein